MKRAPSATTMTAIAVYVDNLIITTTTKEEMDHIKTKLSENVKMKDMGSLRFCLRVVLNRMKME